MFFCKHLYHMNCILKKNEEALSAIKAFKRTNTSTGIKSTTASIINAYLKYCPLCHI